MVGVEGQRVAIAQRSLAVVRPGLTPVRAPHHGAELDAADDDAGIRGRDRDRLHIGGERGLGRRNPQPAAGNAAETFQLAPASALIPGDIDARRFRPGVEHPRLVRAHGQRLDDLAGQAHRLPAPAPVRRAQHAVPLRAGVDHVRIERIRGQTAYVLLPEQRRDLPVAGCLPLGAGDAGAGGGEEDALLHWSACTGGKTSGQGSVVPGQPAVTPGGWLPSLYCGALSLAVGNAGAGCVPITSGQVLAQKSGGPSLSGTRLLTGLRPRLR